MATISEKVFDRNGFVFAIRSPAIKDAKELISLLATVNAETSYLLREPNEVDITVQQEEEFIKNNLNSTSNLFLIAECKSKIIGTLGFQGSTYRRLCHQGEIGVSVLKEYWGRGVGLALVDNLFDWCEHANIVRISLKVAASNERAIRLYEKYGFIEEGVLKKYMFYSDKNSFEDFISMAYIRSELAN